MALSIAFFTFTIFKTKWPGVDEVIPKEQENLLFPCATRLSLQTFFFNTI